MKIFKIQVYWAVFNQAWLRMAQIDEKSFDFQRGHPEEIIH